MGDDAQRVGLVHRRLSIIDLSPAGAQPMHAPNGTVISYNGEIYNFIELREQLSDRWTFRPSSDTEVILAAYDRWGEGCVEHLRGMFAFAIWDERKKKLFAARDRFGIKPFHYTIQKGVLYFSSEAKALLPFLDEVDTDADALSEYLTFQYTIGEKTLFKSISTLLPGHMLRVEDGSLSTRRYWDVQYDVDFDHSPAYFERRFVELLSDSMHDTSAIRCPGRRLRFRRARFKFGCAACRQSMTIATAMRSTAGFSNIRDMMKATMQGR